MSRISFASDNWAGVIPEALAKISEANTGYAHAYGDDPWSDHALALLRTAFQDNVEVFYVFNGTGANVLSLKAFLRSYECVICAEKAHLDVDEGGAPEHNLGTKLMVIPSADGKIRPDQIRERVIRRGDQHFMQPRVVSITQPTEYGALYTLAEIRAIAHTAHELGMYLHIDGARFSNAAAALGCTFADLFTHTGADVLSLGGTKAGLLGAEAVVFPSRHAEMVAHMPWLRKQSMQLASKMRFVAAQFVAWLENETWHRHATHANAMAQRLAIGIKEIPGVTLTQAVQANALFATLPAAAITALQAEFDFYTWDEARNEVRWMTSWQTTESEVDAFMKGILAANHTNA